MSKYFEFRLSKRLGLLLFACMFVGALGFAQNASAVVRVSAGVTYQSGGYDLLSQYGEWMRVPPYGDVWCPYVDASWEPFYDGRWIWTRGGWAWDSYEPFGELVYHYGYWYYEQDIGWFWVPGNEWSPARVQWYSYGDFCGWAPLPPPHYYWPDPWDSYGFNIWVVVNINNFCDDHIGRYGIDRPRYRDVFRGTGGAKRAPDVKRVETVTRRQIPVQRITERPMDIRTDRIKVAERPATRRDVQTRGAVPENRTRATTPARSTVVERKTAVERRSAQPERQTVQPQRQTAKPAVTRQSERQVAAPRQNAQPQREVAAPRQNAQPQRQVAKPAVTRQSERQVAAPRQNAQPQREVVVSRQPARVERKAEAPARSAQSAQSRTEEKGSDRVVGTKEKQKQ